MGKEMRIFIIGGEYDHITDQIYDREPELQNKSYRYQFQHVKSRGSLLHQSYAAYLKELGNRVFLSIHNNDYLQTAWMTSEGIADEFDVKTPAHQKLMRFPLIKRFIRQPNLLHERRLLWLDYQIESFNPDVILSFYEIYNPLYLTKWGKKSQLILQTSNANSLIYPYLDMFNILISANYGFVKKFERLGIKSYYLPLSFDPEWLNLLSATRKKHDVVFVGGISDSHARRTALLEYTASKIPNFMFFGYGIEKLPINSPLHKSYRGEVYGLSMLRVLQESRISLNAHIDVAGKNSGNIRMFETTGVGSLLVTDYKEDNSRLFKPGGEIAEYRSNSECLDMIEFYLQHDTERQAIAKAGQKKCLSNHSVRKRMIQLQTIIG